MKEGEKNIPEQTLFLDMLYSPLYLGADFKASEPRDLILREDDDNNRIALYEISKHRTARIIKTINVGDIVKNRTWITRSKKYFFLRDPAPAIYSGTNLAVVKSVKASQNLVVFNNANGWWPEILTDDLAYLIKPVWEYADETGLGYFDRAYCNKFDTDTLQTITIHNGTNRTVIVDAEDINGRLQFLALWQPERERDPSGESVFVFKHLGVFDDKSSLVAEIPISAMDGRGFSRSAVWDYAHSKVFRYHDRILTEFDYENHTIRRYPLTSGRLKTP